MTWRQLQTGKETPIIYTAGHIGSRSRMTRLYDSVVIGQFEDYQVWTPTAYNCCGLMKHLLCPIQHSFPPHLKSHFSHKCNIGTGWSVYLLLHIARDLCILLLGVLYYVIRNQIVAIFFSVLTWKNIVNNLSMFISCSNFVSPWSFRKPAENHSEMQIIQQKCVNTRYWQCPQQEIDIDFFREFLYFNDLKNLHPVTQGTS